MRALLAILALIAATAAHSAPALSDPSFFPIAVFLQNPTSTHTTMGANLAEAAAAEHMNIFLAVDNGRGATGWPSGFGIDTGQFAAAKANGLYIIGGVNTPTTENTSAASVASQIALATAQGSPQTLIGLSECDEPDAAAPSVPGWSAALEAFATASGRPDLKPYCNMTAWMLEPQFVHVAPNQAALQAVAVASADLYPMTNPWLPRGDNFWRQGVLVQGLHHFARPGQPVWVYGESGSDNFGFSSANHSVCNPATNLCSQGNEYRATPAQVNAVAWASIIAGANGLEIFCHDRKSYSFCLGDTAADPAAAVVAANLTYVDTTIESFATILNSPTVGMCSMISENWTTGAFTTAPSCANGELAMRALPGLIGGAIPGSAMLKSVNGVLYLFAQEDKRGPATYLFVGFPGRTMTVVYDSNARYDPTHSTVGRVITAGAAGFTDTLGAFGNDYQVKVYRVGGPA